MIRCRCTNRIPTTQLQDDPQNSDQANHRRPATQLSHMLQHQSINQNRNTESTKYRSERARVPTENPKKITRKLAILRTTTVAGHDQAKNFKSHEAMTDGSLTWACLVKFADEHRALMADTPARFIAISGPSDSRNLRVPTRLQREGQIRYRKTEEKCK